MKTLRSQTAHMNVRAGVLTGTPKTPIIGSLPWDRMDTFSGEGYLQGEPRWESTVVTELGRR